MRSEIRELALRLGGSTLSLGQDLDLPAHTALEEAQCFDVVAEGESVADEDVGVQDAGREKIGGAFVAVQHGH